MFEGTTDENGNLHVTHLVKHWDQTDGNVLSAPYFIYVITRAEEPDNSAENSFYNFKPFFGGLNINANDSLGGLFDNTRYNIDAGKYDTGPVEYNHNYSKPPSPATGIGLEVAKPEIKGRLMAATNLENIGLSGIEVRLFKKDDAYDDKELLTYQQAYLGSGWIGDLNMAPMIYSIEKMTFTNDAGFFRFFNLPVNTDNNMKPRGPFRRIQIDSKIYKRIIWPPLEQRPYNFVYGDLKYLKFQLEPKNILHGDVVDEEGKAVAAYIRLLPDNPYVKTETQWHLNSLNNLSYTEEFNLPVADSNNYIEVVPLSNQYFPDTLHLTSLPQDNNLHIVVRKKLHRIVIKVRDYISKNEINNAVVIVGDTLAMGTTKSNLFNFNTNFFNNNNYPGTVLLEFASPGQQFTFRISADGYSPAQEIFTIPVSAYPNMIETVDLFPAKSVNGYITEKNSGKPVEGALVFTELQNTGGQSLYVEARSDSSGFYTLKGIPSVFQNIFIHVVKEGKNPSYIGLEKNLNIQDEFTIVNGRLVPVRYDFELEAVNADLSEIWGLPVVIEKVNKTNGKINSVSGYLYGMNTSKHLHCLNSDEKIYFDNLNVSIDNGKLTPSGSNFFTQRHKVPIKLDGGFSGYLTNKMGMINMPLIVSEKNKKGYIGGILKLNLSSFNFAYDFHGDLYLAEDTLQPEIKVFNANTSQDNSQYYVYDLTYNGLSLQPVPINNYRVFGFNASSGFVHSYYKNGSIHIGTILHTAIPLPNGNPAMDLKIKTGDVIITRDDIVLETSSEPLNFDLEKWKVKTTGNWYFDKNRDAIVLTKAVIQTGLGIEAAVKNLLIRPNALREGEFDLGQGLSLGGVVPLHLASGLKPVFNYDAGVGHYRISITGTSNEPTAWIDQLPAMEEKLKFASIDMLSNNTTEMSLGKTYRFHHLIDVFVDQIMSGDDFFSLTGMPNTGVPQMVSGQALMTYYKENGQVKFKMEPLNAAVDCNANVVFNLDHENGKQELKDGLFTSYGKFAIKPPPGESGEPLTVKGKLVRKPDETYIDVFEQDITIGRETMHITEGKITATTDAWNELHYKAYTRSNGLDDNNEVEFVVHGGIEASGDKIEVNNINTPFGDFEMAFLFPETALVGHLSIKVPISTGYGTINNGMMEMRFDPSGFYFGIEANMNIMGLPCEGGLVIGYYSKSLQSVMHKVFAKMHKIPDNLPALKGFYFMGEMPIIDKSFTLADVIDISVVGAIGAYVGANFANKTEIIGGGYGYVYAKGGINVVGCGFVGVENYSWMNMEMQYLNKDVSLCSCGTSSYKVNLCEISGELGLLAKFRISSNSSTNYKVLKKGGSCPSNLCNE